jgi:hypothetical protein
MARYVDDANYYYLSPEHEHGVAGKLTNGAHHECLAPIVTSHWALWYGCDRSGGSQIRGYVNGTLVGEATDSTQPRARAGPSPIARRGFRRLSGRFSP